jgi:hypothetical protein
VSFTPIPNRFVKPTLQTRFHIDFGWWEREGRDFRVDVMSHLPPDQQAVLAGYQAGELVDSIDPETAEVQKVDRLQYVLRSFTAVSTEFVAEHSSLVDAVFHVFLTNGNQPLTPEDLAEKINRPALTILRTLSGARVYKGLRPVA